MGGGVEDGSGDDTGSRDGSDDGSGDDTGSESALDVGDELPTVMFLTVSAFTVKLYS